MQPWKTVSRKTILNHSKYLVVESHTIQLPDGRVLPDWPWVITPDFVNVVAITRDEQYLVFRQTKYGIEGTSLAPVGGYIEPGEDPLAAAQRELLEETGHQASDWISLGEYQVGGNRGIARAHLFLALGAQETAAPTADDLEDQQLLSLGRPRVEAALAAGEFKCLPWATAVALALLAKSGNRTCQQVPESPAR